MELKPGYKLTEVGVIPEDWDVQSLENLTEQQRPISYGIVQTGPNIANGIPCLRVVDIHDGRINKTELIHTSQQISDGYKRTILKVGDLVMPLRGKVGDVGMIDAELKGANLTRGVAILAIRSQSSGKFCRHFISWSTTRKRLEQAMNGSALQEIPIANLRTFKIGLPPLPEQRLIATALCDVDELLGGLDRLITKKRDLKQSAIQQLLTGKIRLPGFDGEWKMKRLGKVVDTDPENLSSDTCPEFAFNYIALEDVDRGFLRSYTENFFANAPSRARRKLRVNDVLVSTVRPNLQSHLIFREEAGIWICSTGFCVIRCREGITNPSYIFFHLFAGHITHQIETLLTGSNYPAINSNDVRALSIPIPSYKEQTAIASILSDMDTEIAALEQRRNKTRDLKQAMMQELLTGRIRLL